MAITNTDNPLVLFQEWFDRAAETEINEPTAVTLATASNTGRPSARMVLLKHYDDHGFVFYTNLDSRKGLELRGNPFAALLFHWKSLKRQIRIEGRVELISDDEADAYFASRDRGSQIGAWASDQSRPMTGRFELEKQIAKFTAKFGVGAVARPPNWSGFRLHPDAFEFWDDGMFRLHERIVYTWQDDNWVTARLFP
ncbi:MAG: pyridoxamine 5'-phosphate oxidase [Rhodospirillaceae bacterium]|jgi:pyridoxamine 5'-phosphate oxidase|nr:pyridoxamine 5'-phosphate oxidase [Rhodospirillaceae bacterium]MBT5664768.1 pyridoxamine 5'-phosphate oxidase [Rhodospirillaceae bacterium]MBT5811970.1 pyridoxamine 5'-phosphate oxidase [Rhodospirillaceae bacterium]